MAETIASAQAQSCADIEIIVVIDGSTDRSTEIARENAKQDDRIRVIEQDNAGVAAARNAGAEAARGRFIAPLDADDLWHPTKLSRQLAVFERDPATGLVYTWFELIDERSRVIERDHNPRHEGSVLEALALRNFVGTGSSVLIPKTVFDASPRYDPSLRARGGEGCEDWKLYFQIAENHPFGLVPAALTGYRYHRASMSSNGLQMLRSRDLCSEDLLPAYPQFAEAFRQSRNRLSHLFLRSALRRGNYAEVRELVINIGKYDPVYLARLSVHLPAGVIGRAIGRRLGRRQESSAFVP